MTGDRIPELSEVASPPRRSLEYSSLTTDTDPIGAGGQAVVYKVTIPDDSPPSSVALKEPANPGTLTPQTVEDFLEETRTWATVDQRERQKPRWADSEHIVGIIDAGDELPWIAMEYMDGGSLSDRLDANPEGLPVDEAMWIGECICRGVELAHSYGIAHLDLKPENVLFRETPGDTWLVPKIADWGLARLLATQTGTMEGVSIEYAAPEQFEPDEFGDPDTLTDIYQLGALIYTLLTGDPPYTGNQASIMYDVVHGDAVPTPSNLRSDLPEALDAAVQTALRRTKSERYRNVATFEQALRAIRTGKPLPSIIAQQVEQRSSQPSATSYTSPTSGDAQESRADSRQVVADVTEWCPMYQVDTARTGHLRHTTGPTDSITEKWRFETIEAVTAPVVVEQTVYAGSMFMSAIDASDGSKRWQFKTGEPWTAPPAVVDGTVYVGNFDGHLYALEAETGEEQWRFETEDSMFKQTPAVVDGSVYFTDNEENVYAIDAETGGEQWRFDIGDYMSSPAVAEGTVFIGTRNKCVYALDAETGSRRWSFGTEGRVESSPAVAAGTVYVGCDAANVYAIDAEAGTEQWSTKTDNAVEAKPAVAGGTVYVGNRNTSVHSMEEYNTDVFALDAETGGVQWRFETDDEVLSPPTVADSTVYIGSHHGKDGYVYALGAETGTEYWQFEAEGRVDWSPAVVDGTVYVGSADGTLYALAEQ